MHGGNVVGGNEIDIAPMTGGRALVLLHGPSPHLTEGITNSAV
jgi:hypothetical protein